MLVRPIDDNNWDVLYALRVELLFRPDPDPEVTSVDGTIRYHTVWWHYAGQLLRGETMGPVLEVQLGDVLEGDYAGVPVTQIVAAIKEAFEERGQAYLDALLAPPPEELPPPPVELEPLRDES